MEAITRHVLITAVITAVMFAEAQLIIWGLSIYHVSSGIWPVWLIGSAFQGILTLGVAAGIRSVKD